MSSNKYSLLALDKIINKSRVHLYKPIQIAEILYHYRKGDKIDLNDVESYRNISKKWRDDVSRRLVGRVSTSSQKFQDNIFEENAMPPKLLRKLAIDNKENGGKIEKYIYEKLKERLSMVADAKEYIISSGINKFNINEFLAQFKEKPGLRRSIDKAYEITVYALFNTLVRVLKVEMGLSINNLDKGVLNDFEKFVNLVLGLSKNKPSLNISARIFRVGATNAADRGLDMWANFGSAIQVKHLDLTEELAEEVTENVNADRIILVCAEADADIIKKVASSINGKNKIKGIITFSDLDNWYRLCFSKKYKNKMGSILLTDLQNEFDFEFPSSTQINPFMKERDY